MKKTYYILAVLLILVVGFFVVLGMNRQSGSPAVSNQPGGNQASSTTGIGTSPTSTIGNQTPPPPVPAKYQALYDTLQKNIAGYSSELSGWDKSTYPVDYSWAVYRGDANAGLSLLAQLKSNLTQVGQELDEDKAMGLKAVSVSINYPLFDQNLYAFNGTADYSQDFISYYVKLAQAIRARGMKIIVESNTLLTVQAISGKTSLDATNYYKSLSLAQYEARRSAMEVIIAQQIKPDYLLLQTEPDTDAMNAYRPEFNDPATDVQMVSQIATDLTNANIPGLHSSIKIGAGVGTWTKNWKNYTTGEIALSGPASLDFLDTHIYSALGPSMIDIAIQMADMAHAAGKGFGMSEFWANKSLYGNDALGDLRARNLFSFWQPLDEQFIHFMVQLANYKKFDYLSVGQNYFYASYVDYASSPCQPAYPAPSKTTNAACDAQITTTQNQLANQAIVAGKLSPTAESYKAEISKY